MPVRPFRPALPRRINQGSCPGSGQRKPHGDAQGAFGVIMANEGSGSKIGHSTFQNRPLALGKRPAPYRRYWPLLRERGPVSKRKVRPWKRKHRTCGESPGAPEWLRSAEKSRMTLACCFRATGLKSARLSMRVESVGLNRRSTSTLRFWSFCNERSRQLRRPHCRTSGSGSFVNPRVNAGSTIGSVAKRSHFSAISSNSLRWFSFLAVWASSTHSCAYFRHSADVLMAIPLADQEQVPG
jgi:hypothetical protein